MAQTQNSAPAVGIFSRCAAASKAAILNLIAALYHD